MTQTPDMPFSTLKAKPADGLLGLIAAFAADPRPDKIDLGVGMFRNENGQTPVMAAVKSAEAALLQTQTTKSYLGPAGDLGFIHALEPLIFGQQSDAFRRTGVQTPGGTGALRLGSDLLAAAGVRRIWVGQPTWVNHAPVFTAAGLAPTPFPMFDLQSQSIDYDAIEAALADARPGDAILVHGCCHNPMGIDPTQEGWARLIALITSRRLLPFIDLAYQGLGHGWEEDVAGTRALLDAVPQALLAYSCDKNFGLYRERVGALWALGENKAAADILLSNILSLARPNWSMPPDHGAAVVRTILQDPALTQLWRTELNDMLSRLRNTRSHLAALGTFGALNMAPLGEGCGMFATLPLRPDQISWLREERGIYMAGSGRINIAGFTTSQTIAKFGQALSDMPV